MKKGILLINLGTPDSPSKKDVKKYLSQFLNDPRVIDINPVGRYILVNGIIVPFRSGKSAKLYEQIWTKEGSPLLVHGNNLKNKLQKQLGEKFQIELGMRYQNPSIESAIKKFKNSGIESITVIPLYPQYAASTTTSSIEETQRVLKKWKNHPPVNYIESFFDHPQFIEAFVQQTKKFDLSSYNYFLFSYHGLPERHITKGSIEFGDGSCNFGDCCNTITERNKKCYRANCLATTKALVNKLSIPKDKYQTTFQSRLDKKWLKPFSDKTIIELANKGIKKILVFSPAFVADCLETIHEIGHEYNELFKHFGGEKLDLVPSLNDSDEWVNCLMNIIK